MTGAVKLIPLLLAWTVMVMVLVRRFADRRTAVTGCAFGGFSGGVAVVAVLLANVRGDLPYAIVKTFVGGFFLFFWAGAALILYRVTGRARPSLSAKADSISGFVSWGATLTVGMLAGAISVCRLLPEGGELSIPLLLILILSAGIMAFAAGSMEKLLPSPVEVTSGALLAMVVSLLLFMSSFTLRLDLFSPLTMKVMKFIHDFIHQFFESMLIPDHPFFRPDVWLYIGYLFGNGVGFWGGVVVWFAPAVMIVLATRLEPLPSVSHVRQGAKRRKMLAAFISERRCRLIVPWLAVLMLAAAVYQSRFPAVEYWDPKPLAVSANPSGQIIIPKKGEIDLEDGKLHKYLFKKEGREARFMILATPDGQLTVTLDACAICKPDGYGQAEGTVICYYCMTLIPLETVGKPGGCNPVPIPFGEKDEGIVIDVSTLLNSWSETVSATSRIEGGGK